MKKYTVEKSTVIMKWKAFCPECYSLEDTTSTTTMADGEIVKEIISMECICCGFTSSVEMQLSINYKS